MQMTLKNQNGSTRGWLEAQLETLNSWADELRVNDPVRFRTEIEQINAHRSWLEGKIRQLTSPSGTNTQTF